MPPIIGKLPWHRFREWLIQIGGRQNGRENCIWVDYPNEQSICFTGNDQSVSLDVHADWVHVYRAFKKLLSISSDVGVGDPQDGLFYDAASFEAFLRANGVKLESSEQDARSF